MSDYDDILGSGELPLVRDSRSAFDPRTWSWTLLTALGIAVVLAALRWTIKRNLENGYRKCVTHGVGLTP